ncbi:MAG TPA: UvrD-helicase domain-containing protein [Pyrinomonadaceae bacterium]|nr:UvrD-helicase domain-containing protein [Pyrinomonadaceae bacterium]
MSSPAQKRQLEPEQAAAAYEIKKHVSVTAGPGSGKTTVLVERYLHILSLHELSIDQIVAITFTNRAANEMRERLRGRLDQILQTAAEKERRRWLHYKRTLDGAVITTIHGFCARLLREFPVEAGIDPQFLLLDEHRAAMLLESAVEETLSEFISSGHEEISRLTLGVGRGKLATALAQLYRDARGQGLSFIDLARKTANSHATEDDHARAVVELNRAMSEFLTVRRTAPGQISNHAKVSSSWLRLLPLIQAIPTAEHLADYCRAIEAFRRLRPQARGNLAVPVTALDELLWKKDLLGRVPQISLDLFARQYALEMVNMLGRIDERLNEEKQKLSALDFDDLELRALALLHRPEVLTRAAERYKFFLVDEFQDTNGLQRRLLEQLSLREGRRESANLFIVGDRKQSIYGFRGADVDVFREMTAALIEKGGETKPLPLNFRSQPPLVNFFNYLFQRLFRPGDEILPKELDELGYVEHEFSEPKREQRDCDPLVELMVTTTARSAEDDDPKAEQTSRELDAEQLVQRINSLTGKAGTPWEASTPDVRVHQFSAIALLFRAMTHVQTYEAAFRRAGISYQTVLGRGFYEREEVTDLIQLLRFLDNKTDELALAALLRSPFCGISDNALLALRCAPLQVDQGETDSLLSFSQTRNLLSGLRRHREIAFITDDEHELLARAAELIKALLARRHHFTIGDLLRFAVERSEYMTVIAATLDAPQRMANVQRLFTLAERFERSGSHLIRDFVRYVKEFEEIGSRESEGQIDEAANAVRLMTIHQAKGLEFPVVIIPDLQRSSKTFDNWVLLDRHHGLTLKVPDGRGKQVAGSTFVKLEARQSRREQFESMRLLYVAATRAEDRLIFSGTAPALDKLSGKSDTWLKWIWQSLELEDQRRSIVNLTNNTRLQLTLNITEEDAEDAPPRESFVGVQEQVSKEGDSLTAMFPLLRRVDAERARPIYRFSVTQLINYRRCPRQYYFDRVLHVPSADHLAVWNEAEAPEPPANLTATVKGAVIHRFCETYNSGDDPERHVRTSLDEIIRQRQAELADRLVEIEREAAVNELLPLAENYISSDLYKRIETARQHSNGIVSARPAGEPGLWSELSFNLHRPPGVLTGAIDKLLVTRASSNEHLQIEIIDFKTNRIHARTSQAPFSSIENFPQIEKSGTAIRGPRSLRLSQQMALDFSAPFTRLGPVDQRELSISDAVHVAARDYQLQMQAYALAVRTLLPAVSTLTHTINVTLHFLEPNVEFHLPAELLEAEACARDIDAAMRELASSLEPEHFPVKPAEHCRMCNFLGICSAGRDWLSQSKT